MLPDGLRAKSAANEYRSTRPGWAYSGEESKDTISWSRSFHDLGLFGKGSDKQDQGIQTFDEPLHTKQGAWKTC